MDRVDCCLLLLLLGAIGVGGLAERVTYSGYSVFRTRPQTLSQVDELRELANNQNEDIEFWTHPNAINSTVDIMVSPVGRDSVQDFLLSHSIPTRQIMYDVGKVIEQTSAGPPLDHNRMFNGTRLAVESSANQLGSASFYKQYQSYDAIRAKIAQLSKDSQVRSEVIGYSTEMRPLYLVKVSTNHTANRPVVFLDAGHHAREWISHATGLYLLESLVDGQMAGRQAALGELDQSQRRRRRRRRRGARSLSVDTIESLKADYDFWFVPVINPDGYEHSRKSNRLWRKTRSRRSFCQGVDPNRNYPFHWAEAGASRFSCDETYAGPEALSEPETRALATVLETNKERIKAYLSLHSYSQVLLSPYGHARVYPENYSDLKRVAEAMIRAISSVRGTEYRFGTSAILLYPAAGGSDDFAYGVANVKYAYTMELPDTGDYGFLMPPSEILPVGEETLVGLAALVKTI